VPGATESVEDELDFRDDAVVSRDAMTSPQRLVVEKRHSAEWNEAFWRTFGWWEHRVITGPEPSLFDCFNQSDALVSDISSVVSDFIASGKPYAVTDSAELGVDEFKRQNTAVRAAIILSNDARQVSDLLDAVSDTLGDTLAVTRHELKHYLLGSDNPTSMEQFNSAVNALVAKAESRNQLLGTNSPPQCGSVMAGGAAD
jgi:CDP-glycerol glycerophosphotransferase (TagB/SpsB family)